MDKLDYKKAYPGLYLPPNKPVFIDIPNLSFIMVDGQGDPNKPEGEYSKALQLLYALSYTISMSGKGASAPEGYFPYVVPPLEGLWWMKDGGKPDYIDKKQFCWISMIRQPEFVTPDVFAWSQEQVWRKKRIDASMARLQQYAEGLCVQCMHVGPFDEELHTLERMEAYMQQNGLVCDIGASLEDGMIRQHHEIYLSDFRKVSPEKNKAVVRHPVRRV